MSFRKRNTVLSAAPSSPSPTSNIAKQVVPGLRPSPLDGRLTTSTGTTSLDALLAGHAGFPLGSSLLVEEQGTTDFAGVLLKYYAAEGLVQGHHVHVMGFSEAWKRELPAVSTIDNAVKPGKSPAAEERMKIAWRYEALGNRSAPSLSARERDGDPTSVFCHSFDLSRRLAPEAITGSFHASSFSSPLSFPTEPAGAPFPLKAFLESLQSFLKASPPSSIHRVVIPSLLSPALYAGTSSHPSEVLQFLHSLRALLRRHSGQVTAMISLQTSLYPRNSGLARWIELLCDGVIELIPLPGGPASFAGSHDKSDAKEAGKAQGMVRVYTLPVYHEKGGGGAEGNYSRENLSFSLSSSKGLVISPYSLPPLEQDDHKEKSPASTVKDGIDF